MKDRYIQLVPTRKYSFETQCQGKKQFCIIRRAIDTNHLIAMNSPDAVLTVYECPWCGCFHDHSSRRPMTLVMGGMRPRANRTKYINH